MPVPQIPTSISNMVDLVTYLNEFYASLATGDAVPALASWEVLYSRRKATGTAADIDFLSTDVTYDPKYEYVAGSAVIASPSPDPTNPVVLAEAFLAGTNYVDYRPDGSTNIGQLIAGGLWFIPAQTNLTGLWNDPTTIIGGNASTRVTRAGLFQVKWLGDGAKDGQWLIARRRRYG